MARAAAGRRRARRQAATGFPRRVVEECVGVALLGIALLAALGLASFDPADPVFSRMAVANRAGVIGATAAASLLSAFGAGAWVIIAVLGLLGGRLVIGRGIPGPLSRFWAASGLLLAATATLPALLAGPGARLFADLPRGILGGGLAEVEALLVGRWGVMVANAALAAIGVLIATGVSMGPLVEALGAAAGALGAAVAWGMRGLGRFAVDLGQGAQRACVRLLRGIGRGARGLEVWREQRARRRRVAAARAPEGEPEDEPAGELRFEPTPAAGRRPPAPTSPRRARGEDPTIVDHGAERAAARKGAQEAFHFDESRPSGPYQLPDLSLFQEPPPRAKSYNRDSLIMNSRILEKKLLDFGVGGQVNTVHPGPVITMYEFEPASGIKLNRIVSLADDLALALRALSVRIIAPLPGKSVVGIEVANPERETVYIRDVLEAESFRSSRSKLSLALGKDIFGNTTQADLAKMPHLLVAGATGTGKSVFLNALLCSILSRATPEDLKLLLVDPKLLELSVYEGIPHLIADVVTNPKRAAAALAGIVHKMEDRYQMMAALGVRSIDQFNARVDRELAAGNKTFRLRVKPGEEEGQEVEYRRFPYIVVVIDELADLMVVSARDVEESLQRLAQMARAAGIHLVLATQRPSVDVLTGVIKANFPARISFQVSSRTDSRTILDQNGADHLLGQGDMLFLPPGTSKLQRIHGAYVSEEEVGRLAAALRAQGQPNFDETLIRMRDEAEAKEARDEDTDEMYDRAIAIVAETRNASISYIQRRLKVGYNRAARMIEQMETEGIVGPQDGTKPRDVYVSQLEP
jgi:S-DNA-T family DNA segregation ATPase FtsK/SpoIIIE